MLEQLDEDFVNFFLYGKRKPTPMDNFKLTIRAFISTGKWYLNKALEPISKFISYDIYHNKAIEIGHCDKCTDKFYLHSDTLIVKMNIPMLHDVCGGIVRYGKQYEGKKKIKLKIVK